MDKVVAPKVASKVVPKVAPKVVPKVVPKNWYHGLGVGNFYNHSFPFLYFFYP